MNLYIVRHAIAEDKDPRKYPDDSLRPLTADGAKKMKEAALGIRTVSALPHLIVSSPYERAKATAGIIADALEMRRKVRFTENLVPGFSSDALIDELNKLSSSLKPVMIVGHEPDLSRLISSLISPGDTAQIYLKKGSLACLYFGQQIEKGKGQLLYFLSPKQLRLLGTL